MLSKIIEEEDIDTAKRLIYNANHIVVTAHISPDGDAVGSTLGLYHFLMKIGKDAVVILPNRFPATNFTSMRRMKESISTIVSV